MDSKNNLNTLSNNNNTDINIFIGFLMTFYSTSFKQLILNKYISDKNSLLYIIKTILTKYYYNTKDTIDFFKIVTPEILLLKFLSLSNYHNFREYVILNNNYKISLLFIYDFYTYTNLKTFNLLSIDNKFYCETNNYIKYNYKKNNYIIYDSINDIEDIITNKLKNKPEIIIIQKENNTNFNVALKKLLINYETKFNLNTYITDIKLFTETIIINDIHYKLDSCIIKSNLNDNYIILFHYNNEKYIYDINNNNLLKFNWNNITTFNYGVNNEFNFISSESLCVIYTIINN
jgi:hypothetical protein